MIRNSIKPWQEHTQSSPLANKNTKQKEKRSPGSTSKMTDSASSCPSGCFPGRLKLSERRLRSRRRHTAIHTHPCDTQRGKTPFAALKENGKKKKKLLQREREREQSTGERCSRAWVTVYLKTEKGRACHIKEKKKAVI